MMALRRILVFTLLGALLGFPAVSEAQSASRILVVPFEDAGSEPRYHWLGEASAVLLADGLRSLGFAAIIRAERVRAFEQLHLPPTAALSRATVIKVGQLVGAGEVVRGSFSVTGEALKVSVRSVRLDVGRLEPEVSETGELNDLFGIFERLAGRLAADAPRAPGPTAAHPPLGAFESYIKGLLAESPTSQATFLESALKEHAGFDRARLALWEVRTEQGNHQAALTAVRAVASGSPSSRRARFFAGVSLLELARYDDSFETFKGLLDESTTGGPSSGAVLNNLGVVQMRRGSRPESGAATYFLTKAAEAEPDPDYFFNLGYAYAAEKHYHSALYSLREALRRDPTDADAHFVLAAALHGSGSTVEAARERDLASQLSARYERISAQPDHNPLVVPAGLERLRLELEGSRALSADHAIVSSAQREQRELATFHLAHGRRLFEREQDREAMQELRRAVYLSPYEAEAHLLIGKIHLRGGRPGDAVEALKISIWSADTAAARVTLAEAYLKSGDMDAARAAVERALVLDPDSADAKRLLTEVLGKRQGG